MATGGSAPAGGGMVGSGRHVAHTHCTRKGGVEARAMAIRPGLWWHVGGGGGGGS